MNKKNIFNHYAENTEVFLFFLISLIKKEWTMNILKKYNKLFLSKLIHSHFPSSTLCWWFFNLCLQYAFLKNSPALYFYPSAWIWLELIIMTPQESYCRSCRAEGGRMLTPGTLSVVSTSAALTPLSQYFSYSAVPMCSEFLLQNVSQLLVMWGKIRVLKLSKNKAGHNRAKAKKGSTFVWKQPQEHRAW